MSVGQVVWSFLPIGGTNTPPVKPGQIREVMHEQRTYSAKVLELGVVRPVPDAKPGQPNEVAVKVMLLPDDAADVPEADEAPAPAPRRRAKKRKASRK